MTLPPGFTPGPNGFKPYLLSADGKSYQPLPGALMRIAVDPRPGHLDIYGVNLKGEVWHSAKGDGTDWNRLPGHGVDVAVRSDGRLVIVGTSPA